MTWQEPDWYAVFDESGNLVSSGSVIADEYPEGWKVEKLPGRPVGAWNPAKRKFGEAEVHAAEHEAREAKLAQARALVAKPARTSQEITDMLAVIKDLYPELA